MQKGQVLILLLVVLFLTAFIGVIFYVGSQVPKLSEWEDRQSSPVPKACTEEAKICPDGSSVGRTGPNCEFAPCPSTPPAKTHDNNFPSPTITSTKPRAYVVSNEAMAPTYITGQIWLYQEYYSNKPERFDVIVLKNPANVSVMTIKRIIGLPDEKIKIKNKEIYINNGKIDETKYLLIPNTTSGQFLNENKDYIIPKDSYFVLGDSRAYSSDSKDYGPISMNIIVGKITNQIQKIDTPKVSCNCWDSTNNFCLPQIACQ